jgi:hypothetical protein
MEKLGESCFQSHSTSVDTEGMLKYNRIMRTTLALITGLLTVVGLEVTGAEQQPCISQIAPTITQLGSGWTSNRVAVLVDPLCSPGEIGESDTWLNNGRALIRNNPRRESYAVLRYYGCGIGASRANTLVSITRWKTKEDIGTTGDMTRTQRIRPVLCPKLATKSAFLSDMVCTTTLPSAAATT